MKEIPSSTNQHNASTAETDAVSPSPQGRGRGEGKRDNPQSTHLPQRLSDTITKTHAVLLSLAAIASFHLAYSFAPLSFLIFIYLACLFQLSRLPSARIAFYFGLATGFFCALQASFFWNIFGPAAIALWLILGFWTGLFVALAQITRARLGRLPALLLIPFLWTGLEYFRSELYYLRFSWLNVGYVFSAKLTWLPLKYLGIYGLGFCLMAIVCLLELLNFTLSHFERKAARRQMQQTSSLPLLGERARVRANVKLTPTLLAGALTLAILAVLINLPSPKEIPSPAVSLDHLRITGVQLEFPSELQVTTSLDSALKKYPDSDLFVLSEYTFAGPIPDSVKNWCRRTHRYLLIGGEDLLPDSQYRDTAFVIGPDGNIIFQQAKSVPIQMFKDGLPAESQKLWNSPWGRIGICICYDLSYTRVTDRLIRLGAQAIFVPSMDVIDWGLHQHELHARVAPTRAAEYSIPIFRVASSGISQCVNASGRVLAAAPVPGEGAIISGSLNLAEPGTLPLDRFLAPFTVVIDSLLIVWLVFQSIISFIKCRREEPESDKLLHRTPFPPLPKGEGGVREKAMRENQPLTTCPTIIKHC